MGIRVSEHMRIKYSFISFRKHLHENLCGFNDHKNHGSFSKIKNIYLCMVYLCMGYLCMVYLCMVYLCMGYIDNWHSRNHESCLYHNQIFLGCSLGTSNR